MSKEGDTDASGLAGAFWEQHNTALQLDNVRRASPSSPQTPRFSPQADARRGIVHFICQSAEYQPVAASLFEQRSFLKPKGGSSRCHTSQRSSQTRGLFLLLSFSQLSLGKASSLSLLFLLFFVFLFSLPGSHVAQGKNPPRSSASALGSCNRQLRALRSWKGFIRHQQPKSTTRGKYSHRCPTRIHDH